MLKIKRVEIQGFKTFANRTEFIYDPGVTAIVGPNGSGKSNVADAVRWCLGEQSFATLRSKKTADVIFAGSDKKARLGMATVSVTLDNSSGELPIDFSEVVITRRAYRDGENEYQLNGKRVRLSDITQLLAPSGLGKRTYAVIGQGLIDQVLSLKPEERRALFEEAAGITGYQAKRTTALRRLEATQQNLERVQDILAELSPRLGYLRRQAERAKERAQVEADLHQLLHIWHGYRWHTGLEDLAQHKEQAEAAQELVRQRRAELEEVGQQIEQLRQTQASLRESLNEQHRISSQLHQQAEQVSRNLAVTQERHRQIQSRREELERELTELRLQKEGLESRLADLAAAVTEDESRLAQRQAEVEAIQAELSQRQAERAGLVEQLEAARSAERAGQDRINERRSRLTQIRERQQKLAQERADMESALTRLTQEVAQGQSALALAEETLAQTQARLAQISGEIPDQEQAIAQAQSALAQAEEARQQADRQTDRLQTRYDLLERLRNEGAGYADGVRAVIQASQRGRLPGIVGTVASQLQVPAELDRAMETALGGAFQNVITESWGETVQAIDYLKEGRGRATFLPLDRVSAGQAIPAPQRPGILGNGMELVQFDERIRTVAAQLLNRTWVATDLAAARSALDQHRGPSPTVVTLGGEIVRPGGAVTGGSDNRRRDDSVLAREREFRRLPEEIRQAQSQAQAAQAQCRALSQAVEEQRAALAQLRDTERQAQADERRTREAVATRRGQLTQAQQRMGWQQGLQAENQAEAEQLTGEEATFQAEVSEAEAELVHLSAALAQAEEAVGEQEVNDLLSRLADKRAGAADAQGTLRSRRAVVAEQERAMTALNGQMDNRGGRLHSLTVEAESLAVHMGERGQEEAQLSRQIAALQAQIDPAERELQRLEQAQQAAEASERTLQKHLRQEETRLNSAQLQLQRTEDRLEALRTEIRNDFGLAEMEEREEMAYQPPLPLSAIVAQLPVVTELPPGLEEEVRETRARLRRLSNVNPDAPREYEEAAGRHGFLLEQSEDLQKASADLRRVIRELDEQMEKALRQTFDAVAKEFVGFFQTLFKGGTASLTLTDADDIINTGVEIIARPPGKRPQSLDLLSGGERSLTACALIFAILRVSPTPFCILDEVDAALDEANVDRFRDVLESLGDQTQFILITHNRRTLEASNTIYGITMGDDGISRVISLRLEGDEMVEINGQEAEVVAM